jgi:hypothetical protein
MHDVQGAVEARLAEVKTDLSRLVREQTLLEDARRALNLGEYPSVVEERLRRQNVVLPNGRKQVEFPEPIKLA